MPTFGSLFAGIGGIDLGLERAGWTCRWQVEWDAYCQRVLAKHWPDVPRYGDITAVDWSGVEPVDLIAGGFPCQPVSVAGKRRGQDDERWLWPEFERAIRSLGPRYVLVENVPGLLVRGMGDVQRGLAELGYRRRWDVLAAADVGAPHLRKRVWIVASRTELPGSLAQRMGPTRLADAASWDDAHGHDAGWSEEAGRTGERRRHGAVPDTQCERLEGSQLEPRGDVGARSSSGSRAVPDTNGLGRQLERDAGLSNHADTPFGTDVDGRGCALPHSDRGDAQGLIQERDDQAEWHEPRERPTRLLDGAGQYPAWPPEPNVGRVAHGVPARVDRLRALGNAVVPQVVEVIGTQLLASLPQPQDET